MSHWAKATGYRKGRWYVQCGCGWESSGQTLGEAEQRHADHHGDAK